MKKIGFLMIALIMGTMVSMAQNWQNSTPEEMAKRQTDQIKEKCGLDKDQEKKVYDLSLKSGKEMAKMREEMQGGGGPSDEMRAKMTKVRDDQNKEMKKILSADQYVKYEKYLEERRAARQQGGGGPR
jgi:biopolymer transport protein ExbD